MYELKKLDFGFVILCPERNVHGLRSTARSVTNYYDVPVLCIAPKETKKKELDEMNAICPTLRGGVTYASLINKGLQKTEAEWNFLIFAGSVVRPLFYRKYAVFVDSDKDILFPIVDQKTSFVEGSMNGIFLNKKILKSVGKMDEEEDRISRMKLMWAYEATQEGYKFKALHGIKVT